MIHRERLIADANKARAKAEVELGNLPVLGGGTPLDYDQYWQAMADAEALVQAAVRYTRHLSALATLDDIAS